MSDTPIFEIRDSSGVARWSISRDGENFRTIGAGHFMCIEMAKEIERLRTALAEAERDAARYRLIAKVVRQRREREPDPGWMDWVVPTARCDSFEQAIEHQATKELAEMQHRMRAAIREEMRNPTEPSKGET